MLYLVVVYVIKFYDSKETLTFKMHNQLNNCRGTAVQYLKKCYTKS